MNAITASAPGARRRKLSSIAQVVQKGVDLIAPRDHAGKGNWDKEADIPRVWAWAAGTAFAAFVLLGRQILGWLLSFAV